MQQNKDIKNLQEISFYASDSNILVKTFESIISQFKLTQVNKMLNAGKLKGVEGSNIFKVLFVLGFIELKNIAQLINSGYGLDLGNKKDVFYSFLKNSNIEWRKILHNFALQFVRIATTKGDHTDNTSPKCLIIDDTLLAKTGKGIETIGKLFDHCSHKYLLGIRMLTLGYWDSKSFIPVDFTLHNEPTKKKKRGLTDKELKAQFSKERPLDSAGDCRIKQVGLDKIQAAISMVNTAIKKGFEPAYILADSWFISFDFIEGIQNIKVKFTKKLHVIGLMKTNRKITIDKKEIMASQVPDNKMSEIKYHKKFKCLFYASKIEYKGIEMKAFWIKMKGQESWKMLICTDTTLKFGTVMKYYQIRWTIEVYFKECKQNLGIETCQSTDFDAQIAHITLANIAYITLALKKRFTDYETMGALFRDLKAELLEYTLVEKIWQLLYEIYLELFAELGVEPDTFFEMMLAKQDDTIQKIKIMLKFLKPELKSVA